MILVSFLLNAQPFPRCHFGVLKLIRYADFSGYPDKSCLHQNRVTFALVNDRPASSVIVDSSRAIFCILLIWARQGQGAIGRAK